MATRQNLARWFVPGVLAIALAAATPGTGAAVPPPPPNPSDGQIEAGKAQVQSKAGEVGKLTGELSKAEARLTELAADVELKMEDANKALVDFEAAEESAAKAKLEADASKAEAKAAERTIEETRTRLDAFANGSYQQGSALGSLSSLWSGHSPREVLERAQLLAVMGNSQAAALESVRKARTEKTNKDSLARKALDQAQAKQDEAAKAKQQADQARAAASRAQAGQAARASELENSRAGVERQLFEAQASVTGLQGQRQRYQDWLAAKKREEEEAARRAEEQARAAAAAAAAAEKDDDPPAAGRPNRPRPVAAAPSGRSAQVVISRALSQLGVVYAWGGGNGSGPTRGIRDGGVADDFGDYRKVGFDCSGLMIYAFAGAGISLPHYSGYQYNAGRKVPLSQMQPADLLFWSNGGGIHHVAMYIGNGRMVEAPYSGSSVRVSPVRYGGIMPNAVRLL